MVVEKARRRTLTSTRRHKRGPRCRGNSSRTGSPSETAATRRCAGCVRATGRHALTFVRSTTPLRRAERRRLCLAIRLLGAGQRKTFRATFRLRQTVTAEAVTNGSSVSVDIPTASAPSPVPPENAVIPNARRRRVARDAATIRGADRGPSLPRGGESPRPRSLLS